MNIIRLKTENPLTYTLDGVDIPMTKTEFLNEKGENDSISYLEIDGRKIYTQHDAAITEKLATLELDDVLKEIEIKRSENKELKDLK